MPFEQDTATKHDARCELCTWRAEGPDALADARTHTLQERHPTIVRTITATTFTIEL
jgi:hypothetical protein